MALYSGENVLITHTASMDGVELTSADVDGVFVSIYDPAGEQILDETAMAWNGTQDRWEYDWDTSAGATPTGLDPGSYKVKVVVYSGADINWEYRKVKLKRNPV